MREIVVIHKTLEEYEKLHKGKKEVLEKLRTHMTALLDMLQGVDEDSFQISKNMIIVLSRVLIAPDENRISLTSKEKTIFKTLVPLFDVPQFLSTVRELYALSIDNTCDHAIREIRNIFSGRCLAFVAEHEASCKAKVMLFLKEHKSGEQADKLLGLQAAKAKASETYNKVSDFCCKYTA